MNLIVLDLEYNQPSRAIIQIGAVLVDAPHITPFFDEHVNPEEPLDPYIQRLTGIRADQLEQAETLGPVLEDLWETLPSGPITLGGWGDDIPKLLSDSHKIGVNPPPIRNLDLSTLWDLVRIWDHKDKAPRTCGLDRLLDFYGLDFEGKRHNALDDAYMTGKLLLRMHEEVLAALGPSYDACL